MVNALERGSISGVGNLRTCKAVPFRGQVSYPSRFFSFDSCSYVSNGGIFRYRFSELKHFFLVAGVFSMASYVSARSMYYTRSQASGELGHVNREFKFNRNVLNSPDDFVWKSCDLQARFLELLNKAEKQKGKRFQKNSNLYLDTVLVLSRERVEELQVTFGASFEQKMRECVARFEFLFKDKFGFEPVGYAFHGDEGHIDPASNVSIKNYHFHVISFNFNFSKAKQPLRNMGVSDWSIVQDIAAESFSSLGFIRGEKKENTKKVHLSKDQFVSKLIKEKEKKIDALDLLVKKKNDELSKLNKCIQSLHNDFEDQKIKIFQLISNTISMLSEISKSPDRKERTYLIDKLFYSYYSTKPLGVEKENSLRVLSDCIGFMNVDLASEIKDRIYSIDKKLDISNVLKGGK